jgi:hypothetical protein
VLLDRCRAGGNGSHLRRLVLLMGALAATLLGAYAVVYAWRHVRGWVTG